MQLLKSYFFLLFSIFAVSSIFGQSVTHIPRENIKVKILAKTDVLAKDLMLNGDFGIIKVNFEDVNFSTVLKRHTLLDSLETLNQESRRITNIIQSNSSLVEKLGVNINTYPFKKEVFQQEIERLNKETKLYNDTITFYHQIKQLLIQTPVSKQDEIDYYLIKYIGDSRNKFDERMFWYATYKYYTNGQAILVDCFPRK